MSTWDIGWGFPTRELASPTLISSLCGQVGPRCQRKQKKVESQGQPQKWASVSAKWVWPWGIVCYWQGGWGSVTEQQRLQCLQQSSAACCVAGSIQPWRQSPALLSKEFCDLLCPAPFVLDISVHMQRTELGQIRASESSQGCFRHSLPYTLDNLFLVRYTGEAGTEQQAIIVSIPAHLYISASETAWSTSICHHFWRTQSSVQLWKMI